MVDKYSPPCFYSADWHNLGVENYRKAVNIDLEAAEFMIPDECDISYRDIWWIDKFHRMFYDCSYIINDIGKHEKEKERLRKEYENERLRWVGVF